ncbi:MAG: HD domain-containing phosphohydrolase [Pseudomonadota bacterium]
MRAEDIVEKKWNGSARPRPSWSINSRLLFRDIRNRAGLKGSEPGFEEGLEALLNPAVDEDISAQDDYCPQISKIVHEMSESLGRAIDAKDPYTKNHSEEVAVAAQAVALAMGFSPQQADVIHIAGHLHDIGKIGVPDRVLAKTGPLTEEEWGLIKKHPGVGAAILAPVDAMARMRVPELVLCHHERFDGNGYPGRLSGRDIPLGSRIIGLADSLSAMLRRRPYRDEIGFEEACREIERCSGSQFDPEVVEAFLTIREPVRQVLSCLEPTPPAPYSLDVPNYKTPR